MLGVRGKGFLRWHRFRMKEGARTEMSSSCSKARRAGVEGVRLRLRRQPSP